MGPITPCGLAAGGAVFIRVRTPNLTYTRRHPNGLVDLQLPHSFDRRYHIPLSMSVTVVYPPQVVLSCTPTLRTYCWSSTNNKSRIQQACFLFFTNNLHPDVKPYYNRLILSDSERTRNEHKRKGHLRHGHQQLVHTSQRDHKPTTHKWMYYLHTSIEILFRDSFKG